MRLYYDTDFETWMITENGAYFELTSSDRDADNPTQIPPLGSSLSMMDHGQATPGITITVEFECRTHCPVPDICPPYDIWEYVDGELVHTSFTQTGFPVLPTQNGEPPFFNKTEKFVRYFNILNSSHFDETAIQLSISDYLIPGNTSVRRRTYPPTSIGVVYHSLDTHVYSDLNTIGLWFQLTDAYGSTFLDLDGVSVSMFADCQWCTVPPTSVNALCDPTSIDDETGFNWNQCEVAIPDNWFVQNETNPLVVYAKLLDDGLNEIAISNMVHLTLAPKIEAHSIDYPGIYGEFAMSPRYATDEVRLNLWLQSDETRYVWLSVLFDHSILRYIEFLPDDDIWGSVRTRHTVNQSNSKGSIQIWCTKIGQLPATNGPNITIGSFVFEVIEGTSDGTYDNVLSFSTLSLSGDNGYTITRNAPGPMADINGWSTFNASLVVVPDDPIKIFKAIDTKHLWNTAFITEVTVRIPFRIFVAYHFQIATANTLTCHVNHFFSIAVLATSNPSTSTCYATATSICYEAGKDIPMNINADGIDDALFIHVWIPDIHTPFYIRPLNAGTGTSQYELNEINMPWRAVGDVLYESLPVYVYCTWTNGVDISGHDNWNHVIINALLDVNNWDISDDNIIELVHDYDSPRYVIRGLAQGGCDVTLRNQLHVFGSVFITVGLSTVNIAGYGGILVTHSELSGYAGIFWQVMAAHLKQYLAKEGDIGSVHPFILLDDGVLIDLTDDENVEYTSTYPDYLEIIKVNKSNGQNMDQPGAYVKVTSQAQPLPWQELVHWNWINPHSIDGIKRSRGGGCILGAINKTEAINVNASVSCDTPVITRIADPADYIFGIPVECYLVVNVYWSDGAVTDMSTDDRTWYTIVEPSNNLIYLDTNIVRADTWCNINTYFTEQNPDCYGIDDVAITFPNYPKLANWTVVVTIEVVIFDRLRLKPFPYPHYDNSTYDAANVLNLFYCSPYFQMSELRIWGNLTNGVDRELTSRTDIILNETDANAILLQNNERLVTGQQTGSSTVLATLAGYTIALERDDYTSNVVDFTVSDGSVTLDSLELYTFMDRNRVFENLINTRELLKLDATFSDGVIISDILRRMVNGSLWPTTAVSDVFTFTSTDPDVISVDENGFVEILDNWWRGVNITVQSQCSAATEAAELVYPNLKPDYWDVDV
eukprot:381052_1